MNNKFSALNKNIFNIKQFVVIFSVVFPVMVQAAPVTPDAGSILQQAKPVAPQVPQIFTNSALTMERTGRPIHPAMPLQPQVLRAM